MPSHDTARRIARLALVLAALASATTLGAQGTMRELYCRGKAGLALKVDQDPSPRDTRDVVMVLEYARSTAVVRDSVQLIAPGTCTWNPYGHPTIPAEPGRVRFDVRRQAQAWTDTGTRRMDTTVGAARFFPDPITLPRYLNDPRHYWKFYVDDATSLAVSYTQMFDDGLPTYVNITGPLVLANDVKRDLICRGGSAGLLFGGGTNAGDNLARVVLSYRVSSTVPGPAGLGLSAGTCAWTDRTAMPKEPGTIAFITARNAQIKQAQSGTIDRTATAAERYPDVFTIPEYLKDSRHYWTFAVMSRDPDSALTNGPWKPDLGSVLATGRTTSTPTTRSGTTSPGSQVYQPGAGAPTASLPTSKVGGAYQPGGAGSTSVATTVFDIRNVQVSPGLEGVAIKFDAAANIKPTVTLTPDNGDAAIPLAVGGVPNGTMWRYSAASTTKLARNAKYAYRIDAPATANARANSTSGVFKTFGQSVIVTVSRIDVLSDGDSDSPGELRFQMQSCPMSVLGFNYLPKPGGTQSWSEGKYPVNFVIQNQEGTSPDQIRVVMLVIEEDGSARGHPYPQIRCTGGEFEPGDNPSYEWNYVVMDFDLTKYPGAKGGEPFARRSRVPKNGSTVAIEIRGSILVIRQ
jgi:hypothetical protein